MSTITMMTRQTIDGDIYYAEWRAASYTDVQNIDTTNLAVGSNVLLTDSKASFYQWNGSAWIEVV